MRLDAFTGLTDGQRAELHRPVAAYLGAIVVARPGGRPGALCLEGSVNPVCVLLRTNLTQDQAAALFNVSQATASCRRDPLRGAIAADPTAPMPTVHEIAGRGGSVLVDGFLAPTWGWKHVDGMYSDKHGGVGFNIQVAASLAGDVAAVGDPVPGAGHDAHALHASGLAQRIAGHDLVGDKGYQGHATIHPIRKPAASWPGTTGASIDDLPAAVALRMPPPKVARAGGGSSGSSTAHSASARCSGRTVRAAPGRRGTGRTDSTAPEPLR